jgi:two-component system, NarL family, sensor kinase
MSRRTAAWLAWSLWAVTVTLTALSLVFLVLNLRYPNAPIPNFWLQNALVVIDVSVGAIVASRRPANPVGWLLCLSGVATSTSTFTSLYAIYALLAQPGSLPAGEASAWIAAWILPIIIGLQISYLL